jgi:hypothetical protein
MSYTQKNGQFANTPCAILQEFFRKFVHDPSLTYSTMYFLAATMTSINLQPFGIILLKHRQTWSECWCSDIYVSATGPPIIIRSCY